jgi:hypothetical protein
LNDDYKVAGEISRKTGTLLEIRQKSDGSMMVERDEVSWNIACYYQSIWAFESE